MRVNVWMPETLAGHLGDQDRELVRENIDKRECVVGVGFYI